MTRHPAWPARRIATLALALGISLMITLTGCGEEAGTADTASESTAPTATKSTTETATESATPTTQTINITVADGKITPNGERVEVKAGEKINLVVSADEPGEIHVHSTPEHELSYSAGESTLPITIDQPGLVDVESHNLDLVIVQLEVR